MKRFLFSLSASFALIVSVIVAGSASAAKPMPFTILDTLGVATPETVFELPGSGGVTLYSLQYAGPRFTITEKTTITEIGAFITGGPPGQVQIRPSRDGVPDSSVVIATLPMPACPAGTICYAAVNPKKNLKVKLAPGTYFAIFVPGPDGGFLLGTAQIPFGYQAEVTTIGFLDPTTGAAGLTNVPGAFRILGR